MPLSTDESLARLRADTAAFAAVLADSGPHALDRAVPACPDWDVRSLVGHLAQVHRWAEQIVRTGERAQAPAPPESDAELVRWAADAAAALVDTLGGADPARPCWTFGPEPRTTAFWFRRQAQETAIHRADLHQALGRPVDLPVDLAIDGLDEVREMFFPRQVQMGRTPAVPERVDLVCAETGRRWTFAGDGTQAFYVGGPDATLTARAADLLLLLWHRADPHDPALSIEGDRAAADRVLAGALTP